MMTFNSWILLNGYRNKINDTRKIKDSYLVSFFDHIKYGSGDSNNHNNGDVDMWFRAIELDLKIYNLNEKLLIYYAKDYLPVLHIFNAIKTKFYYCLRWKKYQLMPLIFTLFFYTYIRNFLIFIKYKIKQNKYEK